MIVFVGIFICCNNKSFFLMSWEQIYNEIKKGNRKDLARAISLVENEFDGYQSFLEMLPSNNTPIIGITGPPGAGKSTMVDALIDIMNKQSKKVGVICVDPSSPFNLGAVLGDRIRMSEWYTNPNVFIRSLATRGSLGGLHPKIIEISDVMKSADFDFIIVETVGVGQSEIEIAGLADVTVVVLVPEAGDEIQTMKSGLMEIADLFVVNKSDRPGADLFVSNLQKMLLPALTMEGVSVNVLKSVASKREGVEQILINIQEQIAQLPFNDKKYWLLAERAFHLIQSRRMSDVSKLSLKEIIEKESDKFNLYQFVSRFS
jgi:LAO/AO transport system kinase